MAGAAAAPHPNAHTLTAARKAHARRARQVAVGQVSQTPARSAPSPVGGFSYGFAGAAGRFVRRRPGALR